MAAFMDLYGEPRVYQTPVPIFSLTNEKFFKLYRYDKATFQGICDMIKDDLHHPKTAKRISIPESYQLAIALRYYATGEFQIDVGEGLHVSQTTVNRCITAVSKALDKRFDDYVRWPTDAATRNQIKGSFFEKAGFPNVIGAIDGTHIRIVKPNRDEYQYVNRKLYHSLNVQAVCDADGKFTNMEVRWPGSAHDSFILRQSCVWDYMENTPFHGYILGDSGYPLRQWLMTPLANPVSVPQQAYNRAHKKTRVCIEHAFGRWKRRFNLMHAENRRRVDNVVLDIRACAVLHNIAVESGQSDFDNVLHDDEPHRLVYEGEQTGTYARQQLITSAFTPDHH